MPKSPSRPTRPRPPTLSRADLVRLVGDLDESVLMAIRETGATYIEVEEAAKAAAGNAEDLARLRRVLGPCAEAVYDILTSEPAFLENDRER